MKSFLSKKSILRTMAVAAVCMLGATSVKAQEFHDEYRKNKQGKPSFVKVMQGINLLKKHGVEWNGMAVVNDYNADYPLEFYNFFDFST